MVFRERAAAEGLVDLRWRASGDEISIGGFRAGLRHGGIERLGVWFFLSRLRDAFATRYLFRIGAFVLTWEGIASGAAGAWGVGRGLPDYGDGWWM